MEAPGLFGLRKESIGVAANYMNGKKLTMPYGYIS